ncbi:MAG TPA: Ig-like domain-containing protein, partial [Gemmatimonadales bacterium]|nr:Ig-like domain-containing protein [Gemmatimonadales bacterium]
MTLPTVALLALALQQPVAPPLPAAPAVPPSPIARLVVTPAHPVVQKNDSLRLRVVALDSTGTQVPNATIHFFGRTYAEGRIDSTGMITSANTGTLPVRMVATVPGTRPYVETLDVPMLPGPAARVDVSPAVTRLVVGQRLQYSASAWSAIGDPRHDTIQWRSNAPSILRVSGDGLVTAVAPGRATLLARAGEAEARVAVVVQANTVASLSLSPASTHARTGDVIRFQLKALDRAGRPVQGLTPQWALAPGQGEIDPDGAFVGYQAGEYVVTALLGERTAQAVVTLEPRDVRRQATLVGRLPRTRFTTEEVWVH